jgi:hypothetical protein
MAEIPKQMRMLYSTGAFLIEKVKKKKQSCPRAELIKHYAMKAYGGVDV